MFFYIISNPFPYFQALFTGLRTHLPALSYNVTGLLVKQRQARCNFKGKCDVSVAS